MFASVIVTTYNSPAWLEKVCSGYAGQTFRDFELVIADDGSARPTFDLLDGLRERLGLPIRHVWHPDEGFRKCEILNRAIVEAAGDYLVFTDGDCIPRPDFLAVHHRLARPGRFLSGGYVKLPMDVSRAITPEDARTGRATDPRWLRAHGAPLTRRVLRLSFGPRMAALLDRITPTRPTFNGHNASVWRDDAIAVNGFEERMGYGGLDREFGERLENAGVRGLQVRHRAHVVHLDHGRGYRDEAVLRRNREIRDDVAASGRTRAVVGIDAHEPS